MSKEEIYLDYAATTPVSSAALAAMQPYFSDIFYNPSSPYAPAVAARRQFEDAKDRLAHTFGAKGDELIMTAGATESINLAFHHVTGHVVTSAIEHPAVLEVAKQHAHTLLVPDKKGIVSAEAVARAITSETELVSIQLANNEIGTVQPIRAISAVIGAERQARAEQGNVTPLLFHSDASQGFGQLDVNVARLGVDLLTLNSGKMYGPKQVGLLWAKHAEYLRPVVVGGGQERGLRSGTENVAGVMGFATAATQAHKKQSSEAKRLGKLRDELEKRIVTALPNTQIIGSTKRRLAGHLAISFPGVDAERLVFILENEGIYIATGSACSANKGTASHVLTALGLPEDVINGSVRLTLGRFTTTEHIERVSTALVQAVKNEYARMEETL